MAGELKASIKIELTVKSFLGNFLSKHCKRTDLTPVPKRIMDINLSKYMQPIVQLSSKFN